jgi:hypothetical protein
MPVKSVRRPLALALLLLFTVLVPASLASAGPLADREDDARIVTPRPALGFWGLLFDLLERLVGVTAAGEIGSPGAPSDPPPLPGDESGGTLDPQG